MVALSLVLIHDLRDRSLLIMIPLALTGLLVGAAYGYAAQRGAFCMSSGFRVVVTRRDLTKVKAYVLAIAVQMLAFPVLFAIGLAQPTYPLLFPLGAVVGGLLFGASMTWAGGCAAGVWYKVGPGSVPALISVIGMAIGATVLEVGPMSGVRTMVQSVGVLDAHAIPASLWAFAPIVGLILMVVLLRAKSGTMGVWSWRRTGLLIGLIGVAAWQLSSLGGRNFGMAVIPGTVGLLTDPTAILESWDILFVIGMPIGGYVAARRGGLTRPTLPPPKNMLRHFIGGLGLGVGASLAAGCTVGHGLTGISLLAPGSILAMVSIFSGSTLVALWQRRQESVVPPSHG
jgi:uncharacterized membrane protein YedE/YeeE